MKKKNIIIILLIVLIASLLAWGLYKYFVPPKTSTYKAGEYDQDLAKQLGYVPGEILIQLKKDGGIDLSTNKGMRDFLGYLKKRSDELTPIIIDELEKNGKLNKDDISEAKLKELHSSLITLDHRFASSNGALLKFNLNYSVTEIVDQLKKDTVIVENASPNYIGNLF